MPAIITKSTVFSGLGASARSKGNAYPCDNTAAIEKESIPAGSVDLPIPFAPVYATLKVIFLIPTGGDLTAKTYLAGSLVQTLTTLKDGVGIDWTNDEAVTNPFTGAFDTIKVSNAGTKAVTLSGGAGFGGST